MPPQDTSGSMRGKSLDVLRQKALIICNIAFFLLLFQTVNYRFEKVVIPYFEPQTISKTPFFPNTFIHMCGSG